MMGLRVWVMRVFAPLWAVERFVDVVLSWVILSLGGVELNPIAALLIAYLGITAGLTVFLFVSVAVGLAAALAVVSLLSCRRCMTRVDHMILGIVGGAEAYGKALLIAALLGGGAPILINTLSLISILIHHRIIG